MNVQEVVNELRHTGARFWLEQHRLMYFGPRLTPEALALLFAHREEALGLLVEGARLVPCPDGCGARLFIVDSIGWCPRRQITICFADNSIN
jgi:hypothetical protein